MRAWGNRRKCFPPYLSFNMRLALNYIARASPSACTEPPVCLPRAPIPVVPRRGSSWAYRCGRRPRVIIFKLRWPRAPLGQCRSSTLVLRRGPIPIHIRVSTPGQRGSGRVGTPRAWGHACRVSLSPGPQRSQHTGRGPSHSGAFLLRALLPLPSFKPWMSMGWRSIPCPGGGPGDAILRATYTYIYTRVHAGPTRFRPGGRAASCALGSGVPVRLAHIFPRRARVP